MSPQSVPHPRLELEGSGAGSASEAAAITAEISSYGIAKVNRRRTLTLDRRPKLTPILGGARVALAPAELVGVAQPGRARIGELRCCWRSGAVLEAPALVAGLDDVAVMGEAVEQRGRHLRIAEHARPFAEGEIGGDDDRGALVEPADEMEQQLPAGLGEGEIAEFVEDDEVEAGEIIGDASLASGARFRPRAG